MSDNLTQFDGSQGLSARMCRRQSLWVLSAASLGFVLAAVFAGVFRLPRSIYLIPYVVLTTVFLWCYARWNRFDLSNNLHHRWIWGLAGGIVAGAFVVQSVLRQPSSPMPQGLQLTIDLFWLGIVYGTLDGLLLSVLPVFAVWQAAAEAGWTARWPGRMGVGLTALIVSMAVILAYHLGYPEFRNTQVLYPVFGVGLMSLAYIITGNPLSAIISHVAMHIASVLHGLQTVMQLPPHY